MVFWLIGQALGSIIGAVAGVSPAGPTAGGLFAAAQSVGGAIAANSTMAAVQSAAMAGVSSTIVATGAAATVVAVTKSNSGSERKRTKILSKL